MPDQDVHARIMGLVAHHHQGFIQRTAVLIRMGIGKNNLKWGWLLFKSNPINPALNIWHRPAMTGLRSRRQANKEGKGGREERTPRGEEEKKGKEKKGGKKGGKRREEKKEEGGKKRNWKTRKKKA